MKAKIKQHLFVGEVVKKENDGEYIVSAVDRIERRRTRKETQRKLKALGGSFNTWKYCYAYHLERLTDGHKEIVMGFDIQGEKAFGSVNKCEVIQTVEERLWNL